MLVLDATTHDFGQSVGVDEIEAVLKGADPRDDSTRHWTLDLSQCRNVEPGAGYRLAAALRRMSAGELEVLTPDPEDFSGAWFRTFTRSGIGLALATYAGRVISDGTDRTASVRKYYAEKGDVSSTNYGVRTAIDTGALTVGEDRFASVFEELAGLAGLSAGDLSRRERMALSNMAYEAVSNVGDHAFRSPWGADPGLSYLSVRHYKKMSAASDLHGGLRSYLSAARATVEATDQGLLGWAEIVVFDDGVGLAARQSQDPEIYSGEISVEDQAVRSALSAASSIKLHTRDAVISGEAGYGYSLIQDALRRLRAYAAIRSGRRLVEFDGTSDSFEFATADAVLGWCPGTTLHIVVPVRDPQLRLTS